MNKPSYSKVNLFIRSTLMLIYTVVTIAPYSFLCLAALPFPLRYRHYLVSAYMKAYFFMLKLICRIDYTIEGMENIPKDRNGIIMCKHQSAWETFLMPVIFDTPAAIAKKELAWVPFFGWGLAVTQPIFIDRSQTKSSMQQILDKGTQFLKQGRWVIFFPEGTRVPYGQVGNYKIGGARLAVASGYPIVPIAHDAGKCWPRRQFIKQPGTIRVVVGPLIESQGKKAEELLRETKTWIESTMNRLMENAHQ